MSKMSSFSNIFILDIIREQNINTQKAADIALICCDYLQQHSVYTMAGRQDKVIVWNYWCVTVP